MPRLQIAQQGDAPVPERHALLQQGERSGAIARFIGALQKLSGVGARHGYSPRSSFLVVPERPG